MLKSGIYKIRNTVNGRVYVGNTTNLRDRFSQHKSCLRKDRHENIKLQRAWNKYGEENFVFEIVEEMIFPENYSYPLKRDYLESLEYYYIQKFDSCKNGYNIRVNPDGPYHSFRRVNSTEISNKRGTMPEYHRRKISEALKKTTLNKGKPSHRRKKVYQYTLDGIWLRGWEFIGDCSKELNIPENRIWQNIAKRTKKCGNWIFSYVEKGTDIKSKT